MDHSALKFHVPSRHIKMKVADWLTEFMQTTVVKYIQILLASAGKTEQIYTVQPRLRWQFYDTASSALLLLWFISSYSRVLVHKTTALPMAACWKRRRSRHLLMIWICRTCTWRATCHAMSDLDEAANQDSVLTTSNTVFVTVLR
jgi:ribosomal protein L37AE/L43A